MKKLLLTLGLVFSICVGKSQNVLDKSYTDSQNAYVISYPSNWMIDIKATKSYATKFNDAEGTASLYVKKTDFGEKLMQRILSLNI